MFNKLKNSISQQIVRLLPDFFWKMILVNLPQGAEYEIMDKNVRIELVHNDEYNGEFTYTINITESV